MLISIVNFHAQSFLIVVGHPLVASKGDLFYRCILVKSDFGSFGDNIRNFSVRKRADVIRAWSSITSGRKGTASRCT